MSHVARLCPRRTIALLAGVALMLNALAVPASADPPPERPSSSARPRPIVPVVLPPGARVPRGPLADGPSIQTHDPFKVDAAFSGSVTLSQGPYYDDGSVHEPWLSLDYYKSTSADTLYWSNNKTLSATVGLGDNVTYALYTSHDGCPNSSTNFNQFSHNEKTAYVTVSWTDNLGSPWTVYNQYWHMTPSSISTGTKANGESFGTQATHPIGGCKYYNAPDTTYHGKLAATGPHIHHSGISANTYESSPIKIVWTMPSH